MNRSIKAMYINKTPSELMDFGDYHEGYLYQEAREYLLKNNVSLNLDPLNPKHYDFFDIPAYIREEVEEDINKTTSKEGVSSFK